MDGLHVLVVWDSNIDRKKYFLDFIAVHLCIKAVASASTVNDCTDMLKGCKITIVVKILSLLRI